VTIHDTTPPRVLSALTDGSSTLNLAFSEPVDVTSGTNPANYVVQPDVPLKAITLSLDHAVASVNFGTPLAEGTSYTVALKGIKDASPAGNAIAATTQPFNAENIVYLLADATLPQGAVKATPLGLPVRKRDPWTMNLLVKADAKPDHRVVLAGFGQPEDAQGAGAGARYLAVFPDDIEFWCGGKNLKTNSPLDLGRWQMLTATYNGDTLALYKDGEPIGKQRLGFNADAEPVVTVGATDPWEHAHTFAGSVKNFTLRRGALDDQGVKKLFEDNPPPP
jgi:alpha-mannosidase